jgi:signal transduction histidine kinase
VRQVLINLLGNAVKFTPDGGVITLTVGRGTIDHRSWGELRVADTGPGIAPAERAAIFEPYYRSETTAMLPGVGLGLAISQGLVQQMGGALAVESEPGAGATFIVRLPLASAMR